jgi:hypothetical protein
LAFAEDPETGLDTLADLIQRIGAYWHGVVNLKANTLADAGRLARAWGGIALGCVRRREINWFFRVANPYIETLLGNAVVGFLVYRFPGILEALVPVSAVFGHLNEPVFPTQFAYYVEATRLACDKVVSTRVDRISVADDDVAFALNIASHPQAADHAEAVHGAVVELVLFAEVGFLESEIRVGKKLPAKVFRPLKTGQFAATA